METLWKEGIDIYDGFARQPFNFRAIIFITIHDYQTLFVLLGQIKGRTGYTVCVDGTVSSFLEGSWKVVYLAYRRFLVEGHRYRSKKFYNHFDGRPEFHLLQYNETGTMFSKWFGPSWSFMGRRRKM